MTRLLSAPLGHSDMEWATPAVSEKFQSRFGWRPSKVDSEDMGLGTFDHTEGGKCSEIVMSIWFPVM